MDTKHFVAKMSDILEYDEDCFDYREQLIEAEKFTESAFEEQRKIGREEEEKRSSIIRDRAYNQGYKEGIEEERESDNWMKKVTEFLENGSCPLCFASDEDDHEDWCAWGYEVKELKKRYKALVELLNEINEAIKKLPATDGRVIGLMHFISIIEQTLSDLKEQEE